MLQLVAGLVLSLWVGLLGYWRGSLTRSGVLGAVLTGTLIFGFGGVVCGILLVAFFLSSSALSHYRARAKATVAAHFQKGARRDLGQALANGGWGALLALLYYWSNFETFVFAAFVGALATVTADTWATEIGVLSKRPPRLLTTGRVVPAGTSGGVTLLGTLTGLAGALFIGLLASPGSLGVALANPFLGLPLPDLRMALANWVPVIPAFVLVAGIGGLAGALFDSLLGATAQASFYCDYDGQETERRVHSCGRTTRLVRGYAWLDNDVVNFLASVAGSWVAALVWTIIFGFP